MPPPTETPNPESSLFPLVSVVIATYNQSRYLVQAIESVIQQSYPNVELIVVDDGSTDATPEVVARYSNALPIRCIRQPNSERGAARNRGLHEAKGEFIAFLDSDDIWLPHKLMREVQFLREHAKVGLVYSDRILIDEEGRRRNIQRSAHHDGWVTKQILKENFICLSANLMRREAMAACQGFPEERGISGSEDWVAWTRLSTVVPFGHLRDITVLYRIHPENTLNNAPWMARATSNAIAHVESSSWLSDDARSVFPTMKANRALFVAINYCSAGDRGKTWHYLRRALQEHWSVALDPRFAYTVVRNSSPWVATLLRANYRRIKQKGSVP